MTTPFDLPPLDAPSPTAIRAARPVGAAPIEGPPLARSIGPMPAMTRGQAATDIVLIVAMFIFLQIGLALGGIPERLAYYFPSLGVFWVNV